MRVQPDYSQPRVPGTASICGAVPYRSRTTGEVKLIEETEHAVPKNEATWPELDVLRGLAVIAMIANHSVVGWHRGGFAFSELAEDLFVLGGFAPVLFFFATGFGSGLQSRRPSGTAQHRYGLTRKLAILVFADQFILWRWQSFENSASAVGLDFLAFVALSTAAVEPLRNTRRPTMIALSAAGIVLALRFVIGPWIVPEVAQSSEMRWFGVLTGRIPLEGVSYPPLPWLAYPFIGFALGRGAGRWRSALERHTVFVLAALLTCAGAGIATSGWLADSGWAVNRYGVHSLAYLPLAIGAVAVAVALSWALGRASSAGYSALVALQRAISIRGIASLAVVPLHLGLVFWFGRALSLPLSDAMMAATIGVVIVLSMAVGGLVARAAEAIERSGYGRLAWLIGATLSVAIAISLLWPLVLSPPLRIQTANLAQLCLCGMLAWSPPRFWRKSARA
ncbi:MAG: heparan-alpha-glucosaminide N-acetyltransferase domain-containing protein [Myxococcota bacterium]|nr:heparan-alpha-glucosaminide N-acetyltransferase domain-containing protein [Myxococcota bacterium]